MAAGAGALGKLIPISVNFCSGLWLIRAFPKGGNGFVKSNLFPTIAKGRFRVAVGLLGQGKLVRELKLMTLTLITKNKAAGALLVAMVPGLLGLAVVPAFAADLLKPHRAVYDLSLDQSSNRSGITAMSGRIVYEITGSSCDGYASRYRFKTQVDVGGKDFVNDQRSTTFESADGKSFDFATQYFLNGQQEQDLRGSATRKGAGIAVAISKPEEQAVELEDAIFMNRHMEMILESAKREETILTAKIFDGSDDGDSLVDTTAIIGTPRLLEGAQSNEPEKVVESIGAVNAWPVSVSYFNDDQLVGGGERVPNYQISFLLQEDGVSRNLKMRYTDYSMKGVLVDLEYLPASTCQ